MEPIYKTNSKETTKSLTEWFFGKDFVSSMTRKAKNQNKKTCETTFHFWQEGTGKLTINLH